VRSARASAAAHTSWARTRDRAARTAPARAAQQRRYLERARELQGPDATDEQVAQAAEHLFLADQRRRALKAVAARRAKRQAKAAQQDRAAS
jgi:hypothetical protein